MGSYKKMESPIQVPGPRLEKEADAVDQKKEGGGVQGDKAVILHYTEKLGCVRQKEDHFKS